MPDLRSLLVSAVGDEPDEHNARRFLAVASDQGLPLQQAADALGLAGNPSWQPSLAEERATAARRSRTVRDVQAALRALAPSAALGDMAWRPYSGSDVDLLVSASLLDEVSRRLADRGFAGVKAHDDANRRVFVRIEDGAAVDLVDVQIVPDAAIKPPKGGTGRLGRLAPDEAAARLRQAVDGRGFVRLVDLADAQELGIAGINPSAATRATVLPRPPAHTVRVGVTGPKATEVVAMLVSSLRVAALDVIELRRPSIPVLAKAIARGMRDGSVVVVADPSQTQSRLLRPSLWLLSDSSLIAPEDALRRVLCALRSPASPTTGRP